jgi:chromosome segregation ATPase
MSNTIDIIRKERNHMENENTGLKEKVQSLMEKLKLYQDSKTLIDNNLKLQNEIVNLQHEISSLRGEVLLKDSKIQELQQNLQISSVALNLQNHFENSVYYNSSEAHAIPTKSNLSLSFGKNREVLKQLYFEISKKTVNNQTLSEALSEKSREFKELEMKLTEQKTENLTLREKITSIQNEKEEKEVQLEASLLEASGLRSANDKQKETNHNLNRQIMDLTKRLTEFRIQYQQQAAESAAQIEDCKKQISLLSAELSFLQNQFQSSKANNQDLTQQLELSERTHKQELDTLKSQQTVLLEKLDTLNYLKEFNEKLTKANESNEVAFLALQKVNGTLENEKYELKGHISFLSFHLKREKELNQQLNQNIQIIQRSLDDCSSEKNQLGAALKQLMDSSKDLLQQNSDLKEKAQELEKNMNEMAKVKENMNSAILNCLFDERMQNIVNRQMDQSHYPAPTKSTIPEEETALYEMKISSESEKVDQVVEQISRGDFDWLNDDQTIQQLLHHSLQVSNDIQNSSQPNVLSDDVRSLFETGLLSKQLAAENVEKPRQFAEFKTHTKEILSDAMR